MYFIFRKVGSVNTGRHENFSSWMLYRADWKNVTDISEVLTGPTKSP
jgi:hypothetical protein